MVWANSLENVFDRE